MKIKMSKNIIQHYYNISNSLKMAEKEPTTLRADDMEVYVRFNEDPDKDYCFHIRKDTSFSDLFKIFNSLPIALRPSIFYDTKPVKFGYSTAPGFLTSNGNILFNYNSDHPYFTKFPKDQLDHISDYVWPYQLIVPIWRFNHFHHMSIILYLLTWLYLDLPDFVSPTPGICPTNLVLKSAAYVVRQFNNGVDPAMMTNLLSETAVNGYSKMGQSCFFVFHLLKCAMLYICLYVGIFNPLEEDFLQTFVARVKGLIKLCISGVKEEKYADLSPQTLVEIGWTGAKKQTIDVHRDAYRKALIEAHGGVVKAHQAGVLTNINNRLGVFLAKGEGFSTPLPEKREPLPYTVLTVAEYPEVLQKTVEFLKKDKSEPSDLAEPDVPSFENLFDSPDNSFKLSYRYFSFYNIAFMHYNGLLENEDFKEKAFSFNGEPLVRNFRSFGSYDSHSKSWKSYFLRRSELGHYMKNADIWSVDLTK